ncbi:MAG: PAS domain S-box protein [Phycisphaerae bacterium]|nr:PAS domain S-box protein [Phycisphaerae bacterium]
MSASGQSKRELTDEVRRLQARVAELEQTTDHLQQTANRLRQARDAAEDLIQAAQAILLVLDTEGHIIRFNPYLEQISGHALEDVRGEDWFTTFVPEKDRERVRALLEQVIAGGYNHGCISPIVTKDGRQREIEWYEKPLEDADGNIVGVLTIGQDVTERKRTADQIARAKEEWERTFDTLPDLVAIVDAEYRIVRANKAVAGRLGVAPGDVVGKTCCQCMHGTDAPPPSCPHALMLEDGKAHTSEIHEKRLGGDFLVTASPLRDSQGRLTGSVHVARDITELRHSEEAYRAIVDHSLQGLGIVQDGRFVFVNRPFAEGLGYTVEELLALPPEQVRSTVHPEDHELVWGRLRDRLMGRPVPDRYEYRAIRKDGAVGWVEIHAALIEYKGRPAVQAAVIEITKRKQAEEQRRQMETQLRDAQKLESLGVLAGGVAHDFNNLLVGVLGNAGLALMDLPEDSPVRATIEKIEVAAQRAADLTKQMLAYSGKGAFIVKPLDVSRLIREMAHLIASGISRKVAIRYLLGDDLPLVTADATQIRQVVLNLISNAAEAVGDAAGAITIRTGVIRADREWLSAAYLADDVPEGDYVCLDVTDTGCGMNAKTQSKVFDPFFSTKFAGRGLGLAAVLGIVRGHKGAIRVDSEPGKGTTFRVLLPATERPAEQDPPPGPKKPREFRGAGTILVADDEDQVVGFASKVLERAGYTVLTAADGRTAVDVFRERAEDVVIVLLDLTMPGLSGVEAFDAIRRIRPEVPVILSSGYSQQDATERFAGKGLSGFIQKPYQAAQLIEKLREVVEG